jgi:ankyrin repeat protein
VSVGHPEKVIAALYAGNVRTVERYVDADNINLVDADGYTLLGRAATAGDLNMRMVRMLLKCGADATVRLQEGWTLLHFACHLLRKDLALALLRAGCDPNAVNDAGETALSKVLWAFDPKKDLIEALLGHGADPDARHRGGESAVEIANRTGQLDLFPSRSQRHAEPPAADVTLDVNARHR